MNWAISDLQKIPLWCFGVITDGTWGNMAFGASMSISRPRLEVPCSSQVPGINQGRAEGIVEFVDIYPTLINLCNLPAPKHTLQGISMQPILSDPSATIKEFAISKWMKGVTLIDDQYFYTEWHDQDRKQVGRMLYDHQVDPNENVNISESPEKQGLVNRLSNKLNKNLPVDYWQAQRGFYPNR
jgi:iduronate 2-sulfatase